MLLSVSNQGKPRSNNADLKPTGYGHINDRCSYTLHAASPVDWMHIVFRLLPNSKCEYRQDAVLDAREVMARNVSSLYGPEPNQYIFYVRF